jgi:hypothetical protein
MTRRSTLLLGLGAAALAAAFAIALRYAAGLPEETPGRRGRAGTGAALGADDAAGPGRPPVSGIVALAHGPAVLDQGRPDDLAEPSDVVREHPADPALWIAE